MLSLHLLRPRDPSRRPDVGRPVERGRDWRPGQQPPFQVSPVETRHPHTRELRAARRAAPRTARPTWGLKIEGNTLLRNMVRNTKFTVQIFALISDGCRYCHGYPIWHSCAEP